MGVANNSLGPNGWRQLCKPRVKWPVEVNIPNRKWVQANGKIVPSLATISPVLPNNVQALVLPVFGPPRAAPLGVWSHSFNTHFWHWMDTDIKLFIRSLIFPEKVTSLNVSIFHLGWNKKKNKSKLFLSFYLVKPPPLYWFLWIQCEKVSKVCCLLFNFKTTFFDIITTVLEQARNLLHHFWIYFVSGNFTCAKLDPGCSYFVSNCIKDGWMLTDIRIILPTNTSI